MCESEGHRLVSVGIGCGRSQIRPSGVCRLIVQRLDIDGLRTKKVGGSVAKFFCPITAMPKR